MVRLHRPTKSPLPPPRFTTGHSRRRVKVSDISNHQQHIPQAQETTKVSDPGPRTRETMATRSRSTSSRLAFGNPKPRNMSRVGITDARLKFSRGPKASCIRCGGICLQCRYRFQCRKSCVVCRIIEPVSPGYSYRLKQKNKSAVRRCRVQSEMLLSETSPRTPSSPCPCHPLSKTRLANLEDRGRADFQAHESMKEVKAVCRHRE